MARRRIRIRAGDDRDDPITLGQDGVLLIDRGASFAPEGIFAVVLGQGGRVDNRGTLAGYGNGISGSGEVTIFNRAGADLTGAGIAVHVTSGTLRMVNAGEVRGGIAVDGLIDFRNVGLGELFSGPVPAAIRASGGRIYNGALGRIENILIDDGEGGTASAGSRVINAGYIHGYDVRIRFVGNQDDVVINRGMIGAASSTATLDLGDGDDRVINTGTISGRVLLGGGDDVFINHGLFDRDIIDGGSGHDRIVAGTYHESILGGLGRDILTGGDGSDRFFYRSIEESPTGRGKSDRITDFNREEGDVIIFDGIDADTTVEGHQSFTFIGTSAFTGTPGELRIRVHGDRTDVLADVDGDGVADFRIRLDGVYTPEDMQFIL